MSETEVSRREEKIDVGRVRRFRRTVKILIYLAFLVSLAATAGLLFPFCQNQLQPEFFVSIAGSILTVLSIVVAVSLLGTQLGSAAGRANPRHALGVSTWLYFAIFLLAYASCLAIGYRTKEPVANAELCVSVPYWRTACLDEIALGRIAVSLISLSIISLIPFVRLLTLRVTPENIFRRDALKVAGARTKAQMLRRLRRFREDLEAASRDPLAFEIGVNFLARAGTTGERRKRWSRFYSNPDFRADLSAEFEGLNNRFREDSNHIKASLSSHFAWLDHIVKLAADEHRTKEEAKSLQQCVRSFLGCATYNISSWKYSESSLEVPRLSVRLALGLTSTCIAKSVKLKPDILSNALMRGLEWSEGPSRSGRGPEFIIRSIVKLLEIVEYSSIQKGFETRSKVVWRSLAKSLTHVSGGEESTDYVRRWIVREVQPLVDERVERMGVDDPAMRHFLTTVRGADARILTALCSGDSKPRLRKARIRWVWQVIESLAVKPESRESIRRVYNSIAELAASTHQPEVVLDLIELLSKQDRAFVASSMPQLVHLLSIAEGSLRRAIRQLPDPPGAEELRRTHRASQTSTRLDQQLQEFDEQVTRVQEGTTRASTLIPTAKDIAGAMFDLFEI